MIHSGRRIIPARAGFTWRRRAACYCAADHPRSRGVYPGRLRPSSTRSGSSPLARGLLVVRDDQNRVAGIIPARAGFTRPGGRRRGRSRDHPRSRGVYSAAPSAHSSPAWIIPARAGFTASRARIACASSDHPRSRGVYSSMTSRLVSQAGSSPLARGLPRRHRMVRQRRRIIPARAGFTRRRTTWRTSATDHPRSRGVYVTSVLHRWPDIGSSPLARGLRTSRRVDDAQWWIIPARAGFTHHLAGRRLGGPDHPRSRGVYKKRKLSVKDRGGSSPLARGLREVRTSPPRP